MLNSIIKFIAHRKLSKRLRSSVLQTRPTPLSPYFPVTLLGFNKDALAARASIRSMPQSNTWSGGIWVLEHPVPF